MTAVLLWVTGVRAIDQHLLENRGNDYRHNIETTSSFIPMPARQSRQGSPARGYVTIFGGTPDCLAQSESFEMMTPAEVRAR